MPEVLHLDIQLPPVLSLRLLKPPATLHADMASVIVGKPGPPGGASGALLAVNRLSEFDTEQKKAEARTNIGLAVIDGGTFF